MRFIGMVLGALALGAGGSLYSAALGGLLGAALAHRFATDRTALRALEARITALERAPRGSPLDPAPATAAPEAVRGGAGDPADPAASPGAALPMAPDYAPAAAKTATVGQPALTPAELFARLARGEAIETTSTVPPDKNTGQSLPPLLRAQPPRDESPAPAHTQPELQPDDPLTQGLRWLSGGNWVARAGASILFVGLAFMMQLAYVAITPSARLGGAALGGAVLLAAGWRLRHARPGYAVSLQGAGVAVLYLTVYGALRLFDMLDAPVAFALMALVATAAATLAVRQESVALAVLSFGGGFLAPILASSGEGSHVALFSYYALVNAGLAAVAWNRAWRSLTFTGFALTFGAAGLWGWKYFEPALFASTQPFLLLFFATYLALQVRFALLRAPRWTDMVDSTSVFGVPLVAFGLQAALVRDFENGAAISAAVLALLYLVLAARMRRQGAAFHMLADAYHALGSGFLVLAVPLAVDAHWIAAAWALQGAGLAWVALHNGRRLMLFLGLGLQVAAACAYTLAGMKPEAGIAVLNSTCLGAVVLALAGLFTAWRLERYATQAGDSGGTARLAGSGLSWALLAWGLFWWVFAGLREIHQHVPHVDAVPTGLLFATLTTVAFQAAHERLSWDAARWPALSQPVAFFLAFVVLWSQAEARPPLAGVGLFAWPAAWITHLSLLSRHDDEPRQAMAALHAAIPASTALVLGWQLDQWLLGKLGGTAWSVIGWALPAAVLLALVTSLWTRRRDVPGQPGVAMEGWLLLGGALLTAALFAWSLLAGLSRNGDAPPIPWLPLVNPLDIAVLLLPLLGLPWLRASRAHFADSEITRGAARLPAALGFVGFINLNTVLLRDFATVLGYGRWGEMLAQSSEVQAGLSLLWSAVALGTMWFASRRNARTAWLAGAGLMAVVVVKLLLVDLRNV